MMKKRLVGPIGTSCLTCKRRRKKCDQGRPACQRCMKGGFECLGYDHIEQRITARLESISSLSVSTQDIIHAPIDADSDEPGLGGNSQLAISIASQHLALSPHKYSESDFYDPAGHFPSADGLLDPSLSTSPGLHLTTSNPWNASLLPSSNVSSRSQPESDESWPSWSHSNRNKSNLLLGARAARALSTLSPITRQLIHYVFNQYERVLDSAYFKPKHAQIVMMQEIVFTRLQASSITRCSVLLGAKMVESLLDGNTNNNRISFERSVQRFESQLQVAKTQHANTLEHPIEFQYLLNGLLEVAFLKMRI
ncbi:hypothetical protein B0J17DRAFT_60711 [Rhizoctonia solani]|nr:hypothetical protein B0J17DRAFT_60711 [Rhizoctonia solani]